MVLKKKNLQTLIGYGGEQAPDKDEFANLLADILVLLVDVKAPNTKTRSRCCPRKI